MINSDPEKLSLGEMYKVAGSYAKGSKEYNHAMEVAAKIYPTVVEAAINAAIIEMEAKQYDRALAILAKSDASDARILALRGNIYAALGDMGKARVEWTNAAAKGNADAQHNLAELDKHLKSL
jgi:predicted negative regulator of RcsB-dependent stress response